MKEKRMNSTDKVFSLYDAALGVLDAWVGGDHPKDVEGGAYFIEGQLEMVGRMLLWSNAVPLLSENLDGLQGVVGVLTYETDHFVRMVVENETPLEGLAAKLARAWTLALFDGGRAIQIDRRGVVELPAEHPRATTCGTCGRSWDNSVSTSVTPTPSGRCPFEGEQEHADDAAEEEV